MRTQRRLVVATLAALTTLGLANPALARHGETPGEEKECIGIDVAEEATEYDSGYC